MEDNLDSWVTIPEAVERTKISQRTIERRIADGSIRIKKRPIPGRKPLVVLHPEDIATLTQQTLKPIVESRHPDHLPTRQSDIVPTRQSDMATLLQAFVTPRISLAEKMYLNLKEASAFSGLPQKHIKQQVQQGVIPAIKLAGWRIRREDLLAYRVAS